MKKILIIYKVKDIDWWILNNTLTEIGGPLGIKFQISNF